MLSFDPFGHLFLEESLLQIQYRENEDLNFALA